MIAMILHSLVNPFHVFLHIQKHNRRGDLQPFFTKQQSKFTDGRYIGERERNKSGNEYEKMITEK